MRRGALVVASVLGAGAGAMVAARAARADEPKLQLQLEAGSELDSNPARQTSDENGSSAPVPAAVGGGGIRLSLGWRPAPRRALRLSAVTAAKKFVGDSSASDEDVVVLAAELGFSARAAESPVGVGARLSYYDAIERSMGDSQRLDHDFRTGDATAQLVLAGENGHHAALSAGLRAFQYKPDARYDFVGEHVQLEWRKSFEPAEDTDDPTWEVAAWYGLARRAYSDRARANICAPSEQLMTNCLHEIADQERVDFAHATGAELTYTGERIYAARYEAQVTLSNSFGQSLVRHRLELSATSETFWSVFVTARAVVQVNQFIDPLLLSRDTGQSFTIEDENRNALILHATRDLGTGGHWAVETRYAFYSNEFATQALGFRRQTGYLGLVWRL